MRPGFGSHVGPGGPVVREKAGFTHDRGTLGSDVRGKRFSAHGAENLSGEKTTIFPTKKQAGHCARPAFIRLPWGN